MKIYSKYTNGCSVSSLRVKHDKLEVSFNFMNRKFKEFKIYADIEVGDGEAYLDFSVIEFYRDRILNQGCNTFNISKVEEGGILLIFSDVKVFIAGYENHTYYTSNITLVIEYEEYERDGTLIDSNVKKIDLTSHF